MAYIIRKPGATVTVEEMTVWCKQQMTQDTYPRHIEFRESLSHDCHWQGAQARAGRTGCECEQGTC